MMTVVISISLAAMRHQLTLWHQTWILG